MLILRKKLRTLGTKPKSNMREMRCKTKRSEADAVWFAVLLVSENGDFVQLYETSKDGETDQEKSS